MKNEITVDGRTLAADEMVTAGVLAERWHLTQKTLAEWRVSGKGPAFIRMGDKGSRVLYKVHEIIRIEEDRNFNSTTHADTETGRAS